MSYLIPVQHPSAVLTAGTVPFQSHQAALRGQARRAILIIGLLAALLLGAAALVQTRAAVVASGTVTVEHQVKKIAHPVGGVIAELYVRDGHRVRRGDRLMRLDDRVTGESVMRIGETVEQLLAQQARLTAERDQAGQIAFPASLSRSNPSAVAAMEAESRLFALRRQARATEAGQFEERIRQAQQQIAALDAQVTANRRQIALIEPERDNLRSLYERRLVTVARLNEVERTSVSLNGDSAALRAQVAQIRAQIAELRQQAAQARIAMATQAGIDLAEVTSRLNEQSVRSVAASDQKDRSLIVAPQDGVIDKLAFTTIGGVVPAGQTILNLVPTGDRLVVEAHVPVTDIDSVRVNQPAELRFSAFNAQTTPQLKGRVLRVAPERTVDERTGASFYVVAVEVSPAELALLNGRELVSGMPVEVFLQTGSRSFLSYLFKPLADQFNRAFREG
ncbi:HlyD family type I secretion periplasmic adaptor subunit [Sphingomonas sp. BGYR3]|uniref:HlyD family type I secretion periplasmic adaptor subunit n=1 Tax=Sphingomonas sp. BGYR3 TaxID=2975483 RepID=UPI0021A69BDD|nr:HlyD family type I secretion periplasmic adaptor subunit [Sphingomonas sp. BGYR3]MDG5489263.1 HlyD family type I secretion periplasmic adaptor subunit [Sphingomonas sp. BGYR3]